MADFVFAAMLNDSSDLRQRPLSDRQVINVELAQMHHDGATTGI